MTTTVLYTHPDGKVSEHVYCLDSRDAVIAAYALYDARDASDLVNCREKYGHLVKVAPHGLVCGNCWAKTPATARTESMK